MNLQDMEIVGKNYLKLSIIYKKEGVSVKPKISVYQIMLRLNIEMDKPRTILQINRLLRE